MSRFVSYAQNHEDVVLARALRPDDGVGFWIDVGAGDPVVDSVTAAFAERGWRGVNIEPLPRDHERLRAARPNDTNLQVALGATAGLGQLFVEPAPDAPGTGALSTMIPDVAARHQTAGREFEPIEVPVWTLEQVVAEHVPGRVDFLKVDVEGFEREVLAGADWSRFRPRIVVVEATVPMSAEPAHETWEPMLVEAGYRLALFDGLNRFYTLAEEPELLEKLAIPANVFDDFETHASTQQLSEVRQWAHTLQDALAYEQEHAAGAEAEAQRLQAELDELQSTRTFRYTAALRNTYSRARRALTERGK